MSEMAMVEIVARALCRRRIEWNRRQDEKPFPSEERIQASVNHAWPDFGDEARAAIAAMRVVPYSLLTVGRDVAYARERELRACGYDAEMRTATLQAQWEAMIDAALRESPGEPQARQERQERGGA